MLTRNHETTFAVIPAVDLIGEEAVRLEQGAFDRVVAREPDPAAYVARLVEAGAQLVHVVDLDGARSGQPRPELVRRLVAAAVVVVGGVAFGAALQGVEEVRYDLAQGKVVGELPEGKVEGST